MNPCRRTQLGRRVSGLGRLRAPSGFFPPLTLLVRLRTPFAFAAALAVVAVGPGSIGMGTGSRHHAHALQTAVVPAQRILAPALQSRATRLTGEVEGLAAELKARQGGTAALRHELVAVSRTRQHTLARLLAKDPQAVHRMILTPRARLVLSRVRGARVETEVALEGQYRVWHHDDFRNEHNDTFLDQLVTRSGKIVTLHGATSGAAVRLTFARLKPDTRISVRGYEFGDHVLVTRMRTYRGRSLASASASTATSVGPINTAVIVANFADSTTSIDVNALKTLFQGNPGHDVVSYFNEASYGKASLVPSFFGPYRLAENTQSGCGNFNQSELLQLANADVDYTQFKRLIYVANCTNAGASASSEGQMSTPDGTIVAATIFEDADYSKMLYTQIHELSHTLGGFNRHASTFVCLPDSFVPPTRFDRGCDTAEYGDAFDVLGGAGSQFIGQLDPYHKSVAGWLSQSQFPTVTTSGTYTLAPYETPGSGIAALNIPRGASGTSLTVEYRQPIGFDSWMNSCGHCTVTQGASIRLSGYLVSGGGGGSDTELIDTTPGTVDDGSYYPLNDFRDGALLPGKTFTDPEYGITITTVSAGASGLAVNVTVPPQTCTRGVPVASSLSPASQTGTGQTLSYTFTLTNTDSAGCAANSFRFFPSWSNSNMQVTATPDVLTLASGASATITVNATPVAPAIAGSYSFSPGQIYSNTLGNYSTTVPAVTYQLTAAADTSVPTVPLSPMGKADGARVVHLAWGASTDNVGVIGYRIVRDNSLTFVTRGPSLVDTSLSPGTTYSYSIQAFDARGNYSAAASVSVSTPAKTDYTPPTSPMVSATATDRTIDLSWGPSSDNVGVAAYRVSPCLVPMCSSLPPSTTALHVGGLTTQTRYDITVAAVDGDGNVGVSRQITIYTGPRGDSPPPQPQRLYSTSGTFAGAKLTWSASTGATAYQVYRNNRPFATVTGTTFTDPSPNAHEYYVQAIDGSGGVSAPTARVWALAPGMASSDMTAPTASMSAPTAGAAVHGQVTLGAQASDDVGVSKVEFYVDGLLAGTSYASPFTFQWDTTRLSDGTHWIYAVAYDAAGNYGSDGGYSVSTTNGGNTVPPSVTITAPTSGATVSGTASIATSVTDSVPVSKVELVVDGSVAATDTAAPYDFTWNSQTVADGSHTIQARAVDTAGQSASDSVTVKTSNASPVDTTPPSAPSGLTAVANGATAVNLSWNASTDDVGVAGYDVYRGGTKIASATGTSYADTGLTAATTYTYTVVAKDAAGNVSAASNTAQATTSATDTQAPSKPGTPKAVVAGTTQIALGWTAATDAFGVAVYELWRDGVKIAETPDRHYLDADLLAATHTYYVVARDAAGNRSAPSSTLSTHTASLSTQSTGTLAGVVYNQLGKALANAVVQVTVNGTLKSAKTSTSGVFKLTSLPPGDYALTFTLSGYQTGSATLTALAGQTVLLTAVLTP